MDTSSFTSAPCVDIPVEYNARDLILYALGIGSSDPRFVYEHHPDFAAFPTYPIVLTFKGDSHEALPFPPPAMRHIQIPPFKNVTALLDAEKLIEKVNELPKEGAKLTLVGGLAGVHRKGKNALVEKKLQLIDSSTGTIYYKFVDASIFVGATDFMDSGESFSKSHPPPSGPPTHVVETPTNTTTPSLYRLSGDYNPLHIDPDFARMLGFKKPIMHGQCTMGHISRAVLDTIAGGDQKRFKSVQVRFASPVIPGQTLVTEIWTVTPIEYIFQTKVKETGKVCVSNGRFELISQSNL